MTDPSLPIAALGLSRRFGQRVALEEVDLEVSAGQIVGLVGPNGAGKTTLLKILAGFLRPHGGTVSVFGLDPHACQAQVMERARFAFAPPSLFDELSPREHLRYLAFQGSSLGPQQRAREVERVLDLVELTDRADDRVGTFSFGMRQRVLIALSLVPTPGLLVLDEPTDGLDPVRVLGLRRLLRRLREEEGTAILLSSHLLGEIEELVDGLLVLREGREAFRGAPQALTEGLTRIHLRTSDLGTARDCLQRAGFPPEISGEELLLPPGTLDAQGAAQLLGKAGLRLQEFRVHRPRLEAALMQRLKDGGSP